MSATTVGWTAVRGATLDEVAATLGWQRSKDRRGQILAAVLPNGWVVIQTGRSARFGKSQATRLSIGHEVLSFWASEIAVASQLECFREGAVAWTIDADGEEPGEVLIAGDVDPLVEEEALAAEERQRLDTADEPRAHGLEAVARIAKRLTGYDTYTANDGLEWESLVEPATPTARTLRVNGGDELRDPALDTVLDAVAHFAAAPQPRDTVSLAVIVDGRRRTLRSDFEEGVLRVVMLGDGVRVARHLDGGAITADELGRLFTGFYPEGKPMLSYRWEPIRK